MATRPHYRKKQTAKRWRSGYLLVAMIACVVVFALSLPTGLLQADESENTSDARKKLLSMVTGDVSRSLAVENNASDELSNPPLFLTAGFTGGTLYAMGRNTDGQLGNGSASDTNTPVLLDPDVFGGPIAPGLMHTLVTDREGNLWVAGSDTNGQFGDGSTISSTATLIQTSVTDIKSVAAGNDHSLILTGDGTVMVTGEGSSGQLGNGGTDTDTFSPINIAGAMKVVSMGNDSFVITDMGELWVFGENLSGELGVGIAGSQINSPQSILTGEVVDVAPGIMHTLVLMADGAVMAMGYNSWGQFGDGTTDSSVSPKIVIPSGVKAIAAGVGFSLFLMADGSLHGAGVNSDGQMGTGDTSILSVMQEIVAGDVADIAAGSEYSLYVTNNGALMGMGRNTYGQLGLGDFSPRLTPTSIVPSGVADVTAGYNNTFFMKKSLTSLEIKGLDTVYQGATANFDCYAQWDDGIISRETAKVFWSENSPTATIELNSGVLDLTATLAPAVIRVTASYMGATATRDVTVIKPPMGFPLYGCGDSSYSQIGRDTTVDQPTPVEITSDRVISIAGGMSHSIYVRNDGSVFSMGDNTYGQLGTGDTIPRTAPFELTLTKPAIVVGAGDYHSFVVFRDGSLYTMGLNSKGQLGDGTNSDRKSPTKIRHTGVVQADGGTGHSIFLTADGMVRTMGRNDEGQLGSDTSIDSTYPYPAYVETVKATEIDAGAFHTIFKTGDTALWGMGDNSRGQLGLGGSVTSQISPTTLIPSDVAHIAAGGNHTLYASSDQRIYVGGANDFGQLGNSAQSTDVLSFTALDGYSEVSTVAAGGTFSFFQDGIGIMSDSGAFDCCNWYNMGANLDGQLGNGMFDSIDTPESFSDRTTLLALGDRHTLFTFWYPPGDVDGNGYIILTDAIAALQIITGSYQGSISPYADISRNGKIGLPEVLYILREWADLYSGDSAIAADKTIAVGEKSGEFNDTVSLPITIDNPTDVAGMAFTLTYDPTELSFEGLEDGAETIENGDDFPDDNKYTTDFYQNTLFYQYNNEEAGKVLIAAAAARTIFNDNVFNAGFKVLMQGNEGDEYIVGIETSQIPRNEDAGYSEETNELDVLTGIPIPDNPDDINSVYSVEIFNTILESGVITYGKIDTPCRDNDNDGFCEDVDCNDNDGNVHPGAAEVCGDGIDQDCKDGDLACASGGSDGSNNNCFITTLGLAQK